MKRLLLVLLCVIFAAEAPGVTLFDNSGKLVNKDLRELLILTEVCHAETLDVIVEKTQAQWLRKGERWDKQELAEEWPGEKRLKVLLLADKLGYTSAIPPSKRHYDTVLFLGAASIRIKDRLEYLVHLWKKGVRFKRIVFLGSTRSLDTPEDDKILQPLVEKEGLSTNELGLMRYIYDHAQIPETMRRVPVQYICTKAPEGKKRADTDDTIKAWLKDPETKLSPSATLLSVSNQPYCPYQDGAVRSVLRDVLKETIPSLETVGPASSLLPLIKTKTPPSPQETSVLLDTIARHLYMVKEMWGSVIGPS